MSVQTQIKDPRPDNFEVKDWPIRLVKDKNGRVEDVRP